jgi:DNA sulfur modification protein DndC
VRISEIVEDIAQAYRSDARPWVVGFSGGKDSTALLQLTYRALKKLPRSQLKKHVYVVCTDTRVEPPNIIEHVDDMLKRVRDAAMRDALPLTVHKLIAPLDERFFVKLIGRGYPAPNRFFRWCTDRLKIRPCSKFIKERIAESGEVVVVLGVRHAEGATRSGSITRHGINGSRFSRHTDLPNAWIYSPIKHLETDALWLYLTLSEPPWGGDNERLARLYKQANGECPLVIDKSGPTCGGSRFGCWTCTVVKSDKSMQGFVENGDEWMTPLLDFRNWLAEIRDDARYRRPNRRNGRPGLGPFTLKARRDIYQRLIEAEELVRMYPQGAGLCLIEKREKALIDKLWREDGYKGVQIAELESATRAAFKCEAGKIERAQRRAVSQC